MLKIKHLTDITMNKENNKFISERLQDTIAQYQVDICNRITKQAILGFVSSSNFQCLLSISSLIFNVLDVQEMLSDEQFSSILNLYNKALYA